MVDPQLEEINIVIIGKHPFESLFHNATILRGKKLSEWNFLLTNGI